MNYEQIRLRKDDPSLTNHPSPENRTGYLTQEIHTKYYNPAGLKIAKEDYHGVVLSRLNK
jgi:hypothetical protein